MSERGLLRFAWLSLATALGTMALKLVAWLITGSVGMLSDAMESIVNLVAAVLLLAALHVARRPPDETHQFGHDKIELFSAGFEGLMILVAAAVIVWTAVGRLIHPRAVQSVGVGLGVSIVAAAANLAVARVLVRAGRRHHSLALVADGRHLLTDVWTSGGVVVGVALVAITGWKPLDPIVALAVGLNIVVTGGHLMWRSARALLDPAIPEDERGAVRDVLARFEGEGVAFHALRTRVAGRRRFVSMHVLVPGSWTVAAGHAVADRLEDELRAAVPHLTVFTHVEPVEEPSSYRDEHLDG